MSATLDARLYQSYFAKARLVSTPNVLPFLSPWPKSHTLRSSVTHVILAAIPCFDEDAFSGRSLNV